VNREGLYRAPYVIRSSETIALVRVQRGSREAPLSAETAIELTPGTFPGAEDCLGPNQTWSASGTGFDYQSLDELPEATVRVPPEYSRSMRARGLAGSFIVNALVCRSGHVMDASASWGEGRAPVPELETAAIEAAKQWIFKPGTIGGQSVATVVAIPFVFPPR